MSHFPLKGLVVGSSLELPARRVLRWWRGSAVEPEMLSALQRVIQPQFNCVDVGAHAGDVLREIVKLAPRGDHYAFEPLPFLNQRILREFPAVTLLPYALSDQTGTATFHHALGRAGWSGLKQRDMEAETLTVETRRLDDLIDRPINFIKIDVEGAELAVMRGAQRIIQTDHPVLLFEHCRTGAPYYGVRPEEVFDFLQGYRIMTLDGTQVERTEFCRIFDAGEANDFLAI